MLKLGKIRLLRHIARFGGKKYVYFCWKKLREREKLGDLRVDGKIIDPTQDRDRLWTRVCVCVCVCGNETSDSTKLGTFLEWLKVYYL